MYGYINTYFTIYIFSSFFKMSQFSKKRVLDARSLIAPLSQPIYFLIFFPEEGKYEVLSSVSTYFLPGTNFTLILEKSTVTLRGGVTGFCLAKSHDLKKLQTKQSRLEVKLGKENLDIENDSFTFLNSTVYNNSIVTDVSDVTCEVLSPSDDYDISDLALNSNNIQCNSGKKAKARASASVESGNEFNIIPTNIDEPMHDKSATTTSVLILQELQKLNKTAKSIFLTQEKMLKQITKIRRDGAALHTAAVPTTRPEPVMFGEINLAELGPRSLDVTNFALTVARKLWSDDELKLGMVSKKRVNRGRPPLSPLRTSLLFDSLKSRFKLDDNGDELEEACRAINQLGNDINSGKRKRNVV